MRNLIVLTVYLLSVVFLLLSSDLMTFSSEKYIDEKVLELSMPFSVKIDVDLLNSLKPADEQ